MLPTNLSFHINDCSFECVASSSTSFFFPGLKRSFMSHLYLEAFKPPVIIRPRTNRTVIFLTAFADFIEKLFKNISHIWNPPCVTSPPMRQPCLRRTISKGSFRQSCVTRAYIGE